MTDERIQDIYDNGAELSSEEIRDYWAETVRLNLDADYEIDPALAGWWIEMIEASPALFVKSTAEDFDWQLEYKGNGRWYLHPWQGGGVSK